MNKEQLARLQEQVRTGGKGSVRRKKKVVHRSASNSKKLQDYLKKLTENIPDIEEVNVIKEDGSVIHFDSPEVQASTDAKTFAVLGHSESMQLSQRMSGLVSQLSSEDSDQLTHLVITLPTNTASAGNSDDICTILEELEAASMTITKLY